MDTETPIQVYTSSLARDDYYIQLLIIHAWLVIHCTYHSEKYKLVSWDYDIPRVYTLW